MGQTGTGTGTGTGGGAGSGSADTGGKFVIASVVLVIALVAYAVLIVYLYNNTDAADLAWTRMVLLLTGVEAITFAGVGWLFGKEVNRGAAEAAKDANKDANNKSTAAGEERGKGKTFAAAVRAAKEDGTVQNELAGVTGASATRSQLDSLVALANELYPPGS